MMTEFKFGYSEWKEIDTCDRCGRVAWGYEFRTANLQIDESSIQLCKYCLLEMAQNSL